MAGFETAGNAICTIWNDERPIITSDLWFEEDPAYFGSWSLSHAVTNEQRSRIDQCDFIFISHGHPDHLNLRTLRNYKHKTIVLAEHYGQRMKNDLTRAGFRVVVYPNRKWINLARGIRVMLFSNELQDSAMLAEVEDAQGNKSLILNLNDSMSRGFSKEVSSIASKYSLSFYLQLHGYGDADMINFYDGNGDFVEPYAALAPNISSELQRYAKALNCTHAIPFSGFHQYQRRDSVWANKYLTPIEAYKQGWSHDSSVNYVPPFSRIELLGSNPRIIITDEHQIRVPVHTIDESEFGDDWTSLPVKSDEDACKSYFYSIDLLRQRFRAINITIGGKKIECLLNEKLNKVLEFECPRTSFMNAVRTNTFDNLLIGNFMRTRCYNFKSSIYNPDFGKTVAKLFDNGGVSSENEVRDYIGFYSRRRGARDKVSMKVRAAWNRCSNLAPNTLRASIKRVLGY